MKVINLLKRYFRTNLGVAMVWFGMMMPMVVSAVGMSVDLGQAYIVHERLSHAIDAAALAATASASKDQEVIEEKVNDFINANYPPNKIGYTFDIDIVPGDNTLLVNATAKLDTSFMKVLGLKKIDVKASSEVTRVIGANIELALVLDISGSMNNNSKIDDLKEAAADLIDVVVYENQQEYYSKVAIVPYGMAVNAGPYADAVRGPVAPPKTITNATKTNPVVITSNGHGYNNGDRVYITGVRGMTQINNKLFTVAGRTANTFQLSGVNGTGYSTYTNTGSLWCTTLGCQYYSFVNPSNTRVTFSTNTCVSERTGINAYTDVPPSTTLVGRNHAGANNPCTTSQILPLTNDKDDLKDAINGLVATGSTGGQVGVGWGMYMLSPSWGYLWPTGSQPAAYKKEELHKIMVLMTDGEYNSPYCNGVIAADATNGSGSAADHINCNATNGNAYAQARLMCDAMKAADKKIEIYTIGFRVNEYPDGEALMRYCATPEGVHFFKADDGNELKRAFQKIAKNISSIYLSK